MVAAEGTPAVTVGVDLGGTKIQSAALVRGTVVPGQRILTPHTGVDDVVAGIATTVVAAAQAAGVATTDLAGVGVGSPGHIDAQQGTVSPDGGCPGKFFLSRYWTLQQGTLTISDQDRQPLAQLSVTDDGYVGQATAGPSVSLSRAN